MTECIFHFSDQGSEFFFVFIGFLVDWIVSDSDRMLEAGPQWSFNEENKEIIK